MIVVSNTTPIIALSSIGKINLLEQLFKKIIVAKAVYKEIKAKESYGNIEIDAAFFHTRSIKGTKYLGFLLNDLDQGEAETIILAKELKAEFIIMDERLGNKIAKSQGIIVIGTLSILILAKKKGLIQNVKPSLDEMIDKGSWYSKRVYTNFLQSIGEL